MSARKLLLWFVLALIALGRSPLVAQAPTPSPEVDPLGPAGALRSQVETAGSYNPHSGNASRSVTDLKVPGALSTYGLDFTRYWNSTPDETLSPTGPTSFGDSSWSHSWEWSAEYWEDITDAGDNTPQIWKSHITITFPDGRASSYFIPRSAPGSGPPRWGPPYNGVPWTEPVAATDHLRDMASDGSSFWLHRSDGGAVHFVGVLADYSGGHAWWTYRATEVYDPHGFKTFLSYGPNNQGLLQTVTEEGGLRWLTFTWGYHNGSVTPVIDSVQSGGSVSSFAVQYGYSVIAIKGALYQTLSTVTYPEAFQNNPPRTNNPGSNLKAVYVYGSHFGDDEVTGDFWYYPLLKEAVDPRYAGPMWWMRYTYRGTQCQEGHPPTQLDYFAAQANAIVSEENGATHQPISTLGINCPIGTRIETNGLGVGRTFYFGRSAGFSGAPAYQLAQLTDFTGVIDGKQSYYNGVTRQHWDGRNTLTDFIPQAVPGISPLAVDGTGRIAEVRHTGADTSVHKYDRLNPGTSAARDPARIPNIYKHWVFNETDENNNVTTYVRDSRRRVTDILYTGGTSEHFDYNTFNQVTAHRMPSNTWQHFEYDYRQRLFKEWNDVDGEANATLYTFDAYDRVETVSDALSRAQGAAFSVKRTYNPRHQVLSEEYPATGKGANPIKRFEFDDNGNQTAVIDELGHRSTDTYDNYRRRTSHTEPLNAPDWKGQGNVPSRTWNWYYDRYFDGGPLLDASRHTGKGWRVQIEPVFNAAGDRRLSAKKYDYNDRVKQEQTGMVQHANGAYDVTPDTETHDFTYDANDNKKTSTDGFGRQTSYDYDLRNRLIRTTEPLNRITETTYDFVGNKTLLKLPDLKTQQWLDYDAFGQPGRFIDERGQTTNMVYWLGPMKKLRFVTTHRAKDGGGMEDQQTGFWCDGIGRPTETDFPDTSYEQMGYVNGQMSVWRNRKGNLKHLFYDARKRETYETWDSDAAPRIDRVWDNANRLTSIANLWSTISYSYDDAGQVLTEGNAIAGSAGSVQARYHRYGDGEVSEIMYPYGRFFRRDYTARGQLATAGVSDGSGNWVAGIVTYHYLADGKVDSEDYYNGVQSKFAYDGRGMMNSVRHFRPADTHNLASRTYWRDDRDRMYAWAKGTDASLNPMENGRGDHYWYDNEGQLTGASYQALDPSGSASSPQRVDSFSYDELGNRVRWNNVASRGPMYFERRDNGLNQYQSWQNNIPAPDPAHWGSGIFYDDNFPYPGWVPPGNGVTMGDGVITASYNALNQPRAISIPAPGSNFMWFGFDPLGRCVKRWIGPYTAPNDPPANTNPATYFYYEGWNLLQEGPASGGWIWNGSAFVMGAGGGMAKCYLHGARVDEIVMSAVLPSGALTFHHYDARGHAIVLSDQSGSVVEQYDYDAFGKPYFYNGYGQSLPNGSNCGNRFLFTGREWLSEVKLYDYRNRLYQPELGRFLQPDPIEFAGGDYNLYRYAHNDPVNRSDPTGLRDPIASDFIWEMAHHFDSANNSQGTFSERMGRLSGGGNDSNGANSQVGARAAGNNVAGQASAKGFDQARFYRSRNLARFERSLAHVVGPSAVYIPAQTLANAPLVDMSLNKKQLYALGITRGARALGSGEAAGMTIREMTPDGPQARIYMASDASSDRTRTYVHELANKLSSDLTGSIKAFGNPRSPDGDHDTGAAVEHYMYHDKGY